MMRALRMLGLTLGLLAALVAGIWVALFATPAGRGLLARVIEGELARATGGPARVGAVEGASPARLVLRDVALSDRRGVFIAIDRAEIVWRPLDAFAGRITVDRAAFEGIEALRRPETAKKERRPHKL
ncbi:MAG: hypothetical protein K2Q06_09005, partial [Parvularculaceae bacterium]|nr:hypothetical protein [Parvularculaceae bacterium]